MTFVEYEAWSIRTTGGVYPPDPPTPGLPTGYDVMTLDFGFCAYRKAGGWCGPEHKTREACVPDAVAHAAEQP